MPTVALQSDVTGNGINQGDLYTLLQNIVDLCNQNRTATNAIITAAATSLPTVAAVTPVANTALKTTKG